MIQQIGFKNFRRFENFPMMTLGKINIFVGRNNAGKSTVMKAIELFKGNVKTLSTFSLGNNAFASMRPLFTFDIMETAEIHIDNFQRALYNKAKRKEITLSAMYNGFTVDIVLDGTNLSQKGSLVSVPYSSIHFYDELTDIYFNYNSRYLKARFKKDKEDLPDGEKVLSTQIIKLTERLDVQTRELANVEEQLALATKTNDLEAVANSNEKIKQWQTRIASTKKELARLEELANQGKDDDELFAVEVENLPEYSDHVCVNLFEQIFENMMQFVLMPLSALGIKNNTDAKKTENQKLIEAHSAIKENLSIIKQRSARISSLLSQFVTEYIPAHAASQKVIFLKEDRHDFLSATLSEFCRLNIRQSDREWQWVQRWMGYGENCFGIGTNFNIEEILGAGYTIKIIDGREEIIDGGEEIDLADKGTGTIQLMTLLLRLAVIMRKQPINATILIEEPEQNIHPCLQSHLADMLEDYQKEFSTGTNEVQLIVETHSECLARRIQGIVGDKNYIDEKDMENNPFFVFYFDADNIDKPWYPMHFALTGNFTNPFGPGFYDTAADLDMKIISREMAANKPQTITDISNLLK